MADIATLSIKVDSSDMGRAMSTMDQMADRGGKLERQLRGIFAGLGLGFLAKQWFDTNMEFQRLGASLQTVEGSAKRAERAFGMLQEFAKNTPYELTEVTQAFIDLRTRGLDASQRSMTALGDYASSFGRSMTDMVRAISGVVVGETEAIKSFGVTAISMGDKVALTFRGQTTIVKRNADAIQGYFTQLSEGNFAGGMERQMKTLGGAWSNLKDQIASTFFTMGNAGASQMMIDAILSITKALADATPALAAFTSSIVGGLGAAVEVINRFKVVILALAALGFVSMVGGWVTSLAAFIVAQRAAVISTLAQNAATGSYVTLSNLAAVGTRAWAGAMTFLTGAGGVLTIALAAAAAYAYLYNKETERMVAESEAAMERFNKILKPIVDLKERIRDLKDENERLASVLAGTKGATAELSQGTQWLIKWKRENANATEAEVRWAKQNAAELDKEIALNQKNKKALEDKNRIEKEKAEEEARNKTRRREFLRELEKEAATLGMTAEEIKRYEAARIGLADSPAVDANIKKIHDYNNAQADLQSAFARGMTAADQYSSAMDSFYDEQDSKVEDALAVIYPYRGELERLGRAYEGLTLAQQNGKITMTEFRRGEEELIRQTRAILPIWTDTFGDMAKVLQDWGARGTDVMVQMAFTWKWAIKDMVDSMLKDLARLAIQRNVMEPLVGYAGTLLRGWLGAGASTSAGPSATGQNPTTALGGNLGFIAGAPDKGGSSSSASVTINITPSGKTDAQTAGQGGADLFRMIEPGLNAWALKNKRAGGLLAGA